MQFLLASVLLSLHVLVQAQVPASCNTGTCRSQYQACQALTNCMSAITAYNQLLSSGTTCNAACFAGLVSSNDVSAIQAFSTWAGCAGPCYAATIGQTDDDNGFGDDDNGVFGDDDDNSVFGDDDDNSVFGDDDDNSVFGDDDDNSVFGDDDNGFFGDDDNGQAALRSDDDDDFFNTIQPACIPPNIFEDDDDDVASGGSAFPYQAADDDDGDDDDALEDPALQRCLNAYKSCIESATCCPAAFTFDPAQAMCSSCMAKMAPKDATGKRLFNNLFDCVSNAIPKSTVSFDITLPQVDIALLLTKAEQRKIIATFATQLGVPAELIELQGLPTNSASGLSAQTITIAITTTTPESAELAKKIQSANPDVLLTALQANSNSFDASTSVAVSQPTVTAGSTKDKSNTGTIAGAAAGGALLVGLLAGAAIAAKRKQTPKGEVLVDDDEEDPENVHPGQAWQPQTGGVPMQPVHGHPPMTGMQQPPVMAQPQQGYAVPQMQQGYSVPQAPPPGYNHTAQYAYPPQDDSEA
eukprot:TRINITY_DN11647_c1_g3_i4.p1 TRINITY_DN11647_c1_g3~~TRINITY_DN11647_c1_g3_i4.p1  ORF type:complete len:557 (+),score=192.32 TRINITY_DN11647_c1_g3_i4:99-1673(+)